MQIGRNVLISFYVNKNQNDPNHLRIDGKSFPYYNPRTDRIEFTTSIWGDPVIFGNLDPEKIPMFEPEITLDLYNCNKDYVGTFVSSHEGLFWPSGTCRCHVTIPNVRQYCNLINPIVYVDANLIYDPTNKYIELWNRLYQYRNVIPLRNRYPQAGLNSALLADKQCEHSNVCRYSYDCRGVNLCDYLKCV